MTSDGWRLHHLGVATGDARREIPMWASVGYVPVTDLIHDPIQRVRVIFLRAGGGAPLIELVEPAADDAPVRRYVGGATRFYHVCFEVPSIEIALQHVRAERWLIVQKPVPAVAYDMRPIAWCYTPARDLIELVEAAPGSVPE